MEVIITKYKRAQIMKAVGMRERGLTVSNIAGRLKIHHTVLRRYLRVYDLYSIEAFAK